jgi:GNAT superfamily N-acetyltransferase
MDGNNITYQMYTAGDEEGIVELLRSVFPKWKQMSNPVGYWSWKHLEGPIPSEVYMAKDGKQVVGVGHTLVLNIKIGNSIMRSTYGDDLAVNPDYRQHGIWTNILKMVESRRLENGVKFHYMATENPIIKENAAKMGFTPFRHNIAHLLKIRNQEAFLKRRQRDNLVTKVGVSALTRLSEVKQILSTRHGSGGDFSIVDVASFDNRIDAFWEKVKNSYDYCIVKKSDYLNWKHSRPSISEYRLRLAIKDDEVLGFSALSLSEEEDYREGLISELLTLPDRFDVAEALIVDASEHFEKEDVAAIHLQATKGHPYEDLAERNGFIDASSQNSTFFYYMIINKSIPTDYIDNLQPSRIQLNYF